jgi:ribonuclease P protein component
VVRNRLRRRLRAALRELLAAGELPGGAYLLTAESAAAEMPWSELVSQLRTAVAEVTSQVTP